MITKFESLINNLKDSSHTWLVVTEEKKTLPDMNFPNIFSMDSGQFFYREHGNTILYIGASGGYVIFGVKIDKQFFTSVNLPKESDLYIKIANLYANIIAHTIDKSMAI
jgi:hypothetical protein